MLRLGARSKAKDACVFLCIQCVLVEILEVFTESFVALFWSYARVQSSFHPIDGGSMPICQRSAMNSPLW